MTPRAPRAARSPYTTSFRSNAGGTTAINGGAITTTAAQTYNDAVTPGAATTLTGVGNTLATTGNGGQALTADERRTTTLRGRGGRPAAPTNPTTNAGGTTAN